MSHLTDALARLENEWQAQDMPIVQLLRPGLTAETITATLRDVRVTPHREVIEWFSWHDGCSDYVEAGFYSRLLGLDEAIEQYVTHVLAGEGVDQLYHPGWFPVADSSPGPSSW
jgi:cell wall assembly regulator SMI1